MTRKKRDTSKKHTAILDAAVTAFMNEGYDNASMDRIAEIAQASKRTVYNHFPSKEILFQEVLRRMMAESLSLKEIDYAPERSLEEQLAEFSKAKMRILENPSWQGLMRVTVGVFISNPELVQKTFMSAEDRKDSLAEWLAAAARDGRLNVQNPKLTATAFWSMIGGAFFWPTIFFGPMPAQQAQELRDELIQIFLARYA